jgi:hypothetical protein
MIWTTSSNAVPNYQHAPHDHHDHHDHHAMPHQKKLHCTPHPSKDGPCHIFEDCVLPAAWFVQSVSGHCSRSIFGVQQVIRTCQKTSLIYLVPRPEVVSQLILQFSRWAIEYIESVECVVSFKTGRDHGHSPHQSNLEPEVRRHYWS